MTTDLISNPFFYFVAVPAVLLNSISKGGVGGAFGGIAVPLMALAISPLQAAAIMLPLLCLADLVGLRYYLGRWDSANLRIIIPGGLLGIVFGAFSFGQLSEQAVRILIGGIAVLFSMYYSLGFADRLAPASRSKCKGLFWSSLSGYTSFVAHAGGPPAMIYLLPQRLEKVTYVATINIFFVTANAVKLIPYAWLGQFTVQSMSASLVLIPLVPAGVKLGIWMQRRVNHVWFYRIAQACLFLSGVQLIWLGIR